MLRNYDLHHAKILVADDVEINRTILDKLILANNGIAVLAHDGKEALDIFSSSEQNEIDLILMDIRMPNMDGISASDAIRAADRPDAKTIPIIALTAEPASQVQEKCAYCGMNLFVQKPFDPDNLLQTMTALTQAQ